MTQDKLAFAFDRRAILKAYGNSRMFGSVQPSNQIRYRE
jgi:hypothetical protein